MKILLTGATGYVGGLLLKRLLANQSLEVRCLVRNALDFRRKAPGTVEIVEGDVSNPPTLARALADVDQAYYLVHSMGSSEEFEVKDRVAAQNFADAATHAGIKRIIYLGGLGEDSKDLSKHLRSRHEVGEILRKGKVPTTEFRASVIIGSGSLSFEMIRTLTERLPVMITPKWVSSKAQPIAIADVLDYLTSALEGKKWESVIYEIGGANVVSYGEMMKEYARLKSLTRYFIPVPFLSPRLSSLWLALITPLYAKVGRKLVESLKCSTVVNDYSALKDFSIRPMGLTEAIQNAADLARG